MKNFLIIFSVLFSASALAAPPQLEVLGSVAPNLSAPNAGSIYFDIASHEFMISQNGGAYQALSGGSSIPAPITLFTPYTADSIGIPGTFIGNNSSLDQANQLVVFGSTDTSGNTEPTSSVYLVSGDLLGSNLSGTAVGNVVLQGGNVVNDVSGSAVAGGNITMNGGNGLDGNAGILQLNGGNSISGDGGYISLVGGTGLTRGGNVSLTAGSSNGINGGVVALAAGNAAVGPGGDVTISSGSGPSGKGIITFSSGAFTRVTISAKGSLDQNAPQSTLTGSAGSAICSEPNQGATYKKVIVYLSGYTDTGTQVYTFPTPFNAAPFVYGLAAGVSGATASQTTLKFTTATATGFVFLEGY